MQNYINYQAVGKRRRRHHVLIMSILMMKFLTLHICIVVCLIFHLNTRNNYHYTCYSDYYQGTLTTTHFKEHFGLTKCYGLCHHSGMGRARGFVVNKLPSGDPVNSSQENN